MFIKDLHGEMVNISEFNSITILYKRFGRDPSHCIVGIHTIHESKPLQRREKIIGIFHFRKQAEMYYEDLMKITAESSELFEMPNPVELIESLDAEAIKELQEYEEQWFKDSGEKPVKVGCLGVLVILFSIAAVFFLL